MVEVSTEKPEEISKEEISGKEKLYKCDDCMRIVYLMEAGRGKELKCCEQKMREMSAEEKKPYHPPFFKPGSP